MITFLHKVIDMFCNHFVIVVFIFCFLIFVCCLLFLIFSGKGGCLRRVIGAGRGDYFVDQL